MWILHLLLLLLFQVAGAKVVTNARSPGSRCYGFVTMSTAEEASKCIQHLHRTELHGRMISVEKVFVLWENQCIKTEMLSCTNVIIKKFRHSQFPFLNKTSLLNQAKNDPAASAKKVEPSKGGGTTAAASAAKKEEKKEEKISPKKDDSKGNCGWKFCLSHTLRSFKTSDNLILKLHKMLMHRVERVCFS